MNWETETIGYGKYVFTYIEIRDLIISVLALGFIFAFGNWTLPNYITAVLIVGPALVLHELAHKFMAQKYGLVAAYVLWPTGVMISVLMSFMTNGQLVFAALGAVMISSVYHTRLGYQFIGLTSQEMGKISWAGPMTNIGLAIASYALFEMTHSPIFAMSASINLIIALFNCLPFPPLDGVKIFRWNIPVWLGTIVSVGVLMILPSYIGIVLSLIITLVIVVALFFWVHTIMPISQQRVTEYR